MSLFFIVFLCSNPTVAPTPQRVMSKGTWPRLDNTNFLNEKTESWYSRRHLHLLYLNIFVFHKFHIQIFQTLAPFPVISRFHTITHTIILPVVISADRNTRLLRGGFLRFFISPSVPSLYFQNFLSVFIICHF